MALVINPPLFTYYICGTELLSLGCLFFLNIIFAVLRPQGRILYFATALLVAIMLVGVWPICGKWAAKRERNWFCNIGITSYEDMVNKVRTQRQRLGEAYTQLDTIVGRSHVLGGKNADDSLSIWFEGRNNNLRSGYLFYNGNQMTHNLESTNAYNFPDNPKMVYRRLTNNWYEY
jgi:hypothetical protein